MTNKCIKIVSGIVLTVVSAFLILCLFLKNENEFWNIQCFDIISIIISIFIAYIGFYIAINITEKNNSKRRLIDKISKLIDDTIELLNTNKLVPSLNNGKLSNEEHQKILMYKRRFKNLFELIKSNTSEFNIKEDLDFINTKIELYNNTIELIFNNTTISSDIINKITNYVDLMYDKFNEIELKLYQC